jgi:hypothetical protein
MRSTSAPASFNVNPIKMDEEVDIIESLPLEESKDQSQALSSTLMTNTPSRLTKQQLPTDEDEDEKRNVSNTSTLSSIM